MVDTLAKLKSLSQPIKVAIIGAGHTGNGLLYQCLITPGIECVAIADIILSKAVDACSALNCQYEIAEDPNSVQDAIRRDGVAVCQNGEFLVQCEGIDVLIESSSSVGGGGHLAATALENGIHVVMMNAEADLMFGPYLMHLAEQHSLVYTSCDGDQPGVMQRLVRDIRLWGFELVMVGNIKGFLDRYANPTSIIPEADKRFLDYKMCTGYTDGTKLSVEMALMANALDLVTDVPGMVGPRAKDMLDVFDLFDFDRLYETHGPVVDYVLGAKPYGGVFVVGRCDHPFQQKMMNYFPSQHGTGPYFIFNRPCHLCHIEAMQCVAEAFLEHEALLQPTFGFKTNVYAYAKKDLQPGERLDGIGGYLCYGLIENGDDNRQNSGIPICLADDVTLKKGIAKDQKIHMDDIVYDPERLDFKLYQMAVEKSKN